MKSIFTIISLLVIGSCGIFKNKTTMILNGRATQETLTNKHYAWFTEEYNSYNSNKELINQLKPLKEDLKVLIVAGTWCGDTQRELPRFFKIANQIGIPAENIEMIMVNEKKQSAAFNISVIQVTNIPTFIFFKDGKEQGRIIEKPKTTIEEDLCNLLNLM
jgi:thiol-disulfide isomerase/thioredoxin